MDYFERLQSIIERFNTSPCYRKVRVDYHKTPYTRTSMEGRKQILLASGGWGQKVVLGSDHVTEVPPSRKGGLPKFHINPNKPFKIGAWHPGDIEIDPVQRTVTCISRHGVSVSGSYHQDAVRRWLPGTLRIYPYKPSRYQSTTMVVAGMGIPPHYWREGLVIHVDDRDVPSIESGEKVTRIVTTPESVKAIRAVGKLVRAAFGPMDKMRTTAPNRDEHSVYGREALGKNEWTYEEQRRIVRAWLAKNEPVFDDEVYKAMLLSASVPYRVSHVRLEQLVKVCQRIVREQFAESL